MKRMVAVLTALILLLSLLPGCTGGGGEKPDVAMGRYVETDIALPELVVEIKALQARADGTLDLLAYVGERQIYLTWFESADSGATWTEHSSAILEEKFNPIDLPVEVRTACWDAEGRLYLHYTIYNESYDEVKEDAVAMLDATDTLTVFDWPVAESSEGSGFTAMRVAENGDLLFGNWAGVVQVDRETGAVKNTYGPKDSDDTADGWDVSGNTLWMSGLEHLRRFDLTTGEETGELSTDVPTQRDVDYGVYYRPVSAGSDGGIYYATDHGVFRALAGSSVTEKLVDGNMSSLGTPTLRRASFTVTKDSFLLLCWSEGSYRLFSYAYSPDVPTVPDKELTIWSIYDTPLIRQAIGEFQKTHSDVYVSYTPALAGGDFEPEGGNSITEDDALKALATELVAGKGPDVLVLDRTPAESYISKGILRDLSADIKPLVDDGTLLPNVANSYLRADGTMCAVPASFAALLMHGETAGIRDLRSLADWVEENKGSFVHPLTVVTPEEYIDLFYPVIAPESDEELRSFLADLKRIYDVERQKPFDDGSDGGWAFQFGALSWLGGNAGMDIGGLQKFEYLYPAWESIQEKGTGEIDTLFGTDGFLPTTVLGVSAQSKQGDLAAEFVKTMLSEPVQASAMGFLPVNAAAFQTSTERKEDGRTDNGYSYYSMGLSDAQGADVSISLQIHYPPEEWRAEMADRLTSLKTPLIVDDTLIKLITDNTTKFFDGSATLDETMAGLTQKLNLYRAELG